MIVGVGGATGRPVPESLLPTSEPELEIDVVEVDVRPGDDEG
jgi:hypothetical protein